MKLPYMQFYCRDWMGEQGLQRLGYAERGLWIELICLMATGDEFGRLTNGGQPLTTQEIARLTRGDQQEVQQLLEHLLKQNVCSQDERGVIYSRRMVKDAHIRTVRAEAGKAGQIVKHAIQKNTDPIYQNPDPRTQSLLSDLLKQKVGKYAEDVAKVLECRPEFNHLIPEDIAQIIISASQTDAPWKKNLTEFLADAANSVDGVKNPTGMLRAYLGRIPKAVFASGKSPFKEPARPKDPLDAICRGENQTMYDYVRELARAATNDARSEIILRADRTMGPDEMTRLKKYAILAKEKGLI